MSVYNNCLLCGKTLNKSAIGDDGSFVMQCTANWSGSDGCYFHLYYTEDDELYEYAMKHPNGYNINEVVKTHHSPISALIDGHRFSNLLVSFQYDIDYFDRKLKTIATFG